MRDASLLARIKTLSIDAQQAIVKSVIDVLPNTEFVSNETEEKRLAICEGCEMLDKETRRCKSCTCFVDEKTRVYKFPYMEPEKCPQNKW